MVASRRRLSSGGEVRRRDGRSRRRSVARETRARLASVVASLVANTLRAASEEHDDGAFEDDDDDAAGDDHAAFVHRTLRSLATDPPLVLAPGCDHPSHSCVVEGVLVRRKVRRNGRDGWTVPGVDERCGVVVMYRTAPGSAAFDDLSDELEPGTCSETRLAGWRRDAAGRRAGARRGAASGWCCARRRRTTGRLASFAENRIEIAEGVPERDASHVCRVLRASLPTTSSLPKALETCDVGVVDGFSAQRIGGDAFAYLQTDRAFTGIIHGVDFVQARAARNLVARALAAVATASVPSVHPVAELAGEEGRREGRREGGAEGGAEGVPRGPSVGR